jgi:RNA polymerase sigma-70 factor (ECF subfamily)
MNGRNDGDEFLMAQVSTGRREALEPLVRRYAGPLIGFIRRMVRDHHRSEELFQDVFLAVWSKRGQYQFPRPFKSWLYAIAMNRCRAAFRSAAPASDSLRGDGDLPPSPDPSPLECVVASETATIVADAILRLPPQQRAVVALRIWDGLSYAEIAEIVGRTEATVRSNMHHGLAALRREMAGIVTH